MEVNKSLDGEYPGLEHYLYTFRCMWTVSTQLNMEIYGARSVDDIEEYIEIKKQQLGEPTHGGAIANPREIMESLIRRGITHYIVFEENNYKDVLRAKWKKVWQKELAKANEDEKETLELKNESKRGFTKLIRIDDWTCPKKT